MIQIEVTKLMCLLTGFMRLRNEIIFFKIDKLVKINDDFKMYFLLKQFIFLPSYESIKYFNNFESELGYMRNQSKKWTSFFIISSPILLLKSLFFSPFLSIEKNISVLNQDLKGREYINFVTLTRILVYELSRF